MQILPFTDNYYGDLATILSATYSDFLFDPELLREYDDVRMPEAFFRRWLCFLEGCCAAYAEIDQNDLTHPKNLRMNIVVHPEFRRRGIGSRLFNRLFTELKNVAPVTICATCRSDAADAVRFLDRQGFETIQEMVELQLDLNSNDLVKESCLQELPRDGDWHIVSAEELPKNPASIRKLYQLWSTTRLEAAWPRHRAQSISSATSLTERQFVSNVLEGPLSSPESMFVAVCDHEYIGFCELREEGDGTFWCGLTGVIPSYRRNGVATALKRHGIRIVMHAGGRRIKTLCASDNLPICALNRKLGFEPRCSWLHFEAMDCRNSSPAKNAILLRQ